MNHFQLTCKEKAEQISLSLNDTQLSQLETFYHLLIEMNQVMNLTAITEEDEVIDKHMIDSLSLALCLDRLPENPKVIDVGTGAGFPGIPLKIAFPSWHITLVDSLKKRLDFLDRVIQECKLEGVETVHGRAEDLGRNPDYREKYDVAVSRAVARLEVLTEYCSPFVKEKGLFVSYKGEKAEEESLSAKNSLKLLQCQIEENRQFVLPGTDLNRNLILIRKTGKTPKAYPRKAGTPSKKPL